MPAMVEKKRKEIKDERNDRKGVYFWFDVESNQRLHCDLTLRELGRGSTRKINV